MNRAILLLPLLLCGCAARVRCHSGHVGTVCGNAPPRLGPGHFEQGSRNGHLTREVSYIGDDGKVLVHDSLVPTFAGWKNGQHCKSLTVMVSNGHVVEWECEPGA